MAMAIAIAMAMAMAAMAMAMENPPHASFPPGHHVISVFAELAFGHSRII